MSSAARQRPLSAASLLTVREACSELRMRRDVAERWLRQRRLVRTVAGRERVVWGDVLDALQAGDSVGGPAPVLELRRAKL